MDWGWILVGGEDSGFSASVHIKVKYEARWSSVVLGELRLDVGGRSSEKRRQ